MVLVDLGMVLVCWWYVVLFVSGLDVLMYGFGKVLVWFESVCVWF